MTDLSLSRLILRSNSGEQRLSPRPLFSWLAGLGTIVVVIGYGGVRMTVAQSPPRNPPLTQPSILAQNPNPILLEKSPDPASTPQPELGLGDQGPLVQQLQFYLKELGYFTPEPDGIYAQSTLEAVRSFQKKRGLPNDGVMNRSTWEILITDYQVKKFNLSAFPPESSIALPSPTPTPADTISLDAPSAPGRSPEPTPQKKTEDVTANTPSAAEPLPPSFLERLQDDRGLFFQVSILTLVGLGLAGSAIVQLTTRKPTIASYLKPEREPLSSSTVSTTALVPDTYAASTDGLTMNGFSDEEHTALTSRAPTIVPASLPERESLRLPVLDPVEQLITHLGSHQVALRHRAIWELGQKADSRAIQPLMDLLPLSDSKQQSLILAAISEIGLKTFKPMKQALAISLDNPNPEVRKNAIRDLQRLYEQVFQSSQLLNYALNDLDPEVQETAEWAVDQLRRLHHNNIPRNLKGNDP